MTETSATSEYCCTCQSWHGIRKYEPRRGKVKYENRAPDIPCNMNYRKPDACPKAIVVDMSAGWNLDNCGGE